jgi:hypothetical protein
LSHWTFSLTHIFTYIQYSTEVVALLEEISALSYPEWLTDAAPFLPDIDLTCVATAGIDFLDKAYEDTSTATISAFLNAIRTACSTSSMLLSGGYDSDAGELEVNFVLMLGGSQNV